MPVARGVHKETILVSRICPTSLEGEVLFQMGLEIVELVSRDRVVHVLEADVRLLLNVALVLFRVGLLIRNLND